MCQGSDSSQPRRGASTTPSTARCPRRVLSVRAAVLVLGAALGAPSARAAAQEPTAEQIVDRAESASWGKTLQAQLTMTVATPRWTRRLDLVTWIERPRRSFVRILAPAKEAGIGSLRIGAEMWNYLPTVERTIKIPPSMMLQPWMGSDFTNDDLVKESSLLNDYTHRLIGTDTVAGVFGPRRPVSAR